MATVIVHEYSRTGHMHGGSDNLALEPPLARTQLDTAGTAEMTLDPGTSLVLMIADTDDTYFRIGVGAQTVDSTVDVPMAARAEYWRAVQPGAGDMRIKIAV